MQYLYRVLLAHLQEEAILQGLLADMGMQLQAAVEEAVITVQAEAEDILLRHHHFLQPEEVGVAVQAEAVAQDTLLTEAVATEMPETREAEAEDLV